MQKNIHIPASARKTNLDLQLMVGFHLLPQRGGERQQTALIHVETAVLVAADDVEGERRAVFGHVPVHHHELQDGAADGLALLQETDADSDFPTTLISFKRVENKEDLRERRNHPLGMLDGDVFSINDKRSSL